MAISPESMEILRRISAHAAERAIAKMIADSEAAIKAFERLREYKGELRFAPEDDKE